MIPEPAEGAASPWAAIDRALARQRTKDLSWIEPPPRQDDWTLAPDALRLLIALVEELRPRHVVEFGAGLSTRVLAHACAKAAPFASITSIENDPTHAALVAEQVERDGQGAMVTGVTATLVTRPCSGRLRPVYMLDGQTFGSPLPADLVVVDGPPAVLGGRGGTLYQVARFSRVGTLVLLDDADREQERRILADWQDDFGDTIQIRILPGFVKGLAAIAVRSTTFVARAVDV